MAASINKVILVGNLGRDPEVRVSQDGSKIANISIATSDTWKDKITGEKKERTEWHRVVIFNPQIAEYVEKYVTKGAKLYIEGQLQTRKWQDQSGADKYTTEITITRFKGELVIIDSKNDTSSSYDSSSSKDLHDDIPF